MAQVGLGWCQMAQGGAGLPGHARWHWVAPGGAGWCQWRLVVWLLSVVVRNGQKWSDMVSGSQK